MYVSVSCNEGEKYDDKNIFIHAFVNDPKTILVNKMKQYIIVFPSGD